jgi:hypothetical protein
MVRAVNRASTLWLFLTLPPLAAGCQVLMGVDEIRYEELGGSAGAEAGAGQGGGQGGSGQGGGAGGSAQGAGGGGQGGGGAGPSGCDDVRGVYAMALDVLSSSTDCEPVDSRCTVVQVGCVVTLGCDDPDILPGPVDITLDAKNEGTLRIPGPEGLVFRCDVAFSLDGGEEKSIDFVCGLEGIPLICTYEGSTSSGGGTVGTTREGAR